MKREDDGLGPNSWEMPRRKHTPPAPTPIADFLRECVEFFVDCWLAVVSTLAVVGLIGMIFYVAIQEQAQWNDFAANHACKVVAKKRGEVFTTTGIGANGQIVIGTGSTSDQTAYLCDDGVTYWR